MLGGRPSEAKWMPFGFLPLQTAFLASMVAADFAFGLVVKNVLAPTHILSVVRIDMVIPVMLMLTARKVVDRFGTLILYQAVWGTFALFAMPAALGLPGILKLPPVLLQGLVMDSLMSILKRRHRARFILAALSGGVIGSLCSFSLKVALGMPWTDLIRWLFGVQLFTGMFVWAAGAALALMVWERIKDTQMVKRLTYVPSD